MGFAPTDGVLQQFSCMYTTVGTFHATSLQGFGYDDVVHQFENRYKKFHTLHDTSNIIFLMIR